VSGTAFALVLSSAFLHAIWSTAIKGSRDPLAFNLLQTLVTLIPAAAIFAVADLGAIPPPVWLALLGTSISHGFYFYFLSRALDAGELTLVYPIARSTPAFLPLVAVPLLGESISLGGGLGIATVVAGMWLVHSRGRLAWSALVGPGTAFAYLTLATTVAYSLFDKAAMARLAAQPPQPIPASILFYFLLSTGSALCFLPLAALRVRRHALVGALRREGGRAVAAAAVGFVGYGLILEAYRSAPASYVVAVRQTSVIFAVGLGILWLRERPGRIRTLGALATVIGVGLIGVYA
jgi:drug/metabolite transporter (DMT)-like permease